MKLFLSVNFIVKNKDDQQKYFRVFSKKTKVGARPYETFRCHHNRTTVEPVRPSVFFSCQCFRCADMLMYRRRATARDLSLTVPAAAAVTTVASAVKQNRRTAPPWKAVRAVRRTSFNGFPGRTSSSNAARTEAAAALNTVRNDVCLVAGRPRHRAPVHRCRQALCRPNDCSSVPPIF